MKTPPLPAALCAIFALVLASLPAAAQDAAAPKFDPSKASASLVQVFGVSQADPTTGMLGLGFVVGPAGMIVTNYSTIDGAASVLVTISSTEKPRPAEILAVDKEHNIAILQIRQTNMHPLALADSGGIANGEYVTAVGAPANKVFPVVEGAITALPDARYYEMQLSAPMAQGYPGSPVFTLDGRVIGLSSFYIPAHGNKVPLAIPSNLITALITRSGIDLTAKRVPARGQASQPVAQQNPPPGAGPAAAATPAGPAPVPDVDITTAKSGAQIGSSGNQLAGTASKTHLLAVKGKIHFFQPPANGYTAECFFIAKSESTGEEYIYDIQKMAGPAQQFSEIFFDAPPLEGTSSKWTSLTATATASDFNGNNLTATATLTQTDEMKGSKFEGWIVRIVVNGQIVKVTSNQGVLEGEARRNEATLNAAASRVR